MQFTIISTNEVGNWKGFLSLFKVCQRRPSGSDTHCCEQKLIHRNVCRTTIVIRLTRCSLNSSVTNFTSEGWFLGSGCGAVGREVAFKAEVCGSNPFIGKNYIEELLTLNCIEKTKNEEKRPGMARSKQNKSSSKNALGCSDGTRASSAIGKSSLLHVMWLFLTNKSDLFQRSKFVLWHRLMVTLTKSTVTKLSSWHDQPLTS